MTQRPLGRPSTQHSPLPTLLISKHLSPTSHSYGSRLVVRTASNILHVNTCGVQPDSALRKQNPHAANRQSTARPACTRAEGSVSRSPYLINACNAPGNRIGDSSGPFRSESGASRSPGKRRFTSPRSPTDPSHTPGRLPGAATCSPTPHAAQLLRDCARAPGPAARRPRTRACSLQGRGPEVRGAERHGVHPLSSSEQ